jgi:hypothetical protein
MARWQSQRPAVLVDEPQQDREFVMFQSFDDLLEALSWSACAIRVPNVFHNPSQEIE